MEELIGHLRQLQANAFIYYSKAHGYHWDVEGVLFDQFHSLFSEVYEDAFESVDHYAEWIRIFNAPAAFDVVQLSAVSNVKYDLNYGATNPVEMTRSLYASNERIIEDLKLALSVASQMNEEGVANFMAERLESHQKWQWKFRSIITTTINS
jgi:starvation-inducible DNA-binding protein